MLIKKFLLNICPRHSLSVDETLRLVAGRRREVDRVYAMFPRLAERRGHGGAQLSGGEQQMLAIGRALLLNPKLLVMDEPTEGLAPVIVQALGQQIAALKREGLTILLSEQNLKFAARLADRAYIIEKGQIRWEGRMERLTDDEATRRAYLTV